MNPQSCCSGYEMAVFARKHITQRSTRMHNLPRTCTLDTPTHPSHTHINTYTHSTTYARQKAHKPVTVTHNPTPIIPHKYTPLSAGLHLGSPVLLRNAHVHGARERIERYHGEQLTEGSKVRRNKEQDKAM